jgi:hypothetical protein
VSAPVKRHPIRAIFGGAFFGLGLTLLLVNFKVVALGTNAPFVVFAIGLVVGAGAALFAPPRPRLFKRRAASTPTS